MGGLGTVGYLYRAGQSSSSVSLARRTHSHGVMRQAGFPRLLPR